MTDAQDFLKSGDKIAVIPDASRSTDMSSLRSFIGMANYYRKFVLDFASTFHPLTTLPEKDRKFEWTDMMDDAFLSVKRALGKSGFLMHFDSSLPVTVACDASPVGLAPVLSYIMPNGEEQLFQFASRSLTRAEQKIEREGLGIIFDIKRFYPFMFGRKFTLVTNNKPLAVIINPRNDIPAVGTERIQRWAIYLSGFNYDMMCGTGAVLRVPMLISFHGYLHKTFWVFVSYLSLANRSRPQFGKIHCCCK